MIYCVVCHDPLGTGQGKIVERGYTAPPSYHIERLRNAPVGYLFAVISEGYGSMPSYGAQIPVRDRWAIVGYLRALQASQHFPEATADRIAMRREMVASRPQPSRREEHRHEQQRFGRPTHEMARWQRRSLGVGVVALVRLRRLRAVCSRRTFFRAYLAAYLFFLGIALGSMVLLMVYHLTGGSWGFLIRRILEAAMRTLPLLAVLFLPIACGIGYLYLWAQPDVVAASPQAPVPAVLPQPTYFWIRAAVYFVLWLAMACLLSPGRGRKTRPAIRGWRGRACNLAATARCSTASASTSRRSTGPCRCSPMFHSTIWGPLFAAGQLLSALAFALVVLGLADRPAAAGRGGFARRSATTWAACC